MGELFSGSEFVELDAPKGKKFVWVAAPVCLVIVAILVLWVPSSRSLSSQTSSARTIVGEEELELPTISFPEDFQVDNRASMLISKQPKEQRAFGFETTTKSSTAQENEDVATTKSEMSTKLVTTKTTGNSSETAKPATTVKPTTTAKLPTPSAIQLNELRECQTGGDYEKVNASGVNFGAYDFMQSSWNAMAELSGRTDLIDVRPDKAKPQDQDILALELYYGGYTEVSWPECGVLLL